MQESCLVFVSEYIACFIAWTLNSLISFNSCVGVKHRSCLVLVFTIQGENGRVLFTSIKLMTNAFSLVTTVYDNINTRIKE